MSEEFKEVVDSTDEVKEEPKVTMPETHEDFSSIKPLLIIIIILLTILTIGIGILIFGSFRDRCHGSISDYIPQVTIEDPIFDVPNNWSEDMYQLKKPNIYIYPEQESEVNVYLTADDMLTTWPKANLVDEDMYNWSVTAEPDGTLYQDEYEYSYLFWEAETTEPYDFEKGFCVKGSETGEFLRSTLSQIGLTPREYNEFIVFWLPQMEQNEYNLISFVGLDSNDDYNTTYLLTVVDENGNEPNMLRVNMIWKASDYTEIEPQTFTTFDRTGFTIVEWGGKEVK